MVLLRTLPGEVCLGQSASVGQLECHLTSRIVRGVVEAEVIAIAGLPHIQMVDGGMSGIGWNMCRIGIQDDVDDCRYVGDVDESIAVHVCLAGEEW